MVPILAGLSGRGVKPLTWASCIVALVGVGLLEQGGAPPGVGDIWNLLSALFFGLQVSFIFLHTATAAAAAAAPACAPALTQEQHVNALLIVNHAAGTAWQHSFIVCQLGNSTDSFCASSSCSISHSNKIILYCLA